MLSASGDRSPCRCSLSQVSRSVSVSAVGALSAVCLCCKGLGAEEAEGPASDWASTPIVGPLGAPCGLLASCFLALSVLPLQSTAINKVRPPSSWLFSEGLKRNPHAPVHTCTVLQLKGASVLAGPCPTATPLPAGPVILGTVEGGGRTSWAIGRMCMPSRATSPADATCDAPFGLVRLMSWLGRFTSTGLQSLAALPARWRWRPVCCISAVLLLPGWRDSIAWQHSIASSPQPGKTSASALLPPAGSGIDAAATQVLPQLL